MQRTNQQERINKLFSSLQEIVYSQCKGLRISDEFFLENPIKLKSTYSGRNMPVYSIIDVYAKSFIFRGEHYGRILLFEGGLVEIETKNKDFSNYTQKIVEEYQKATHHTAVYYYHF